MASCRTRRPATSRKIYFRFGRVHARISSPSWCASTGADHVIMGTDYPFDMAEYDPIGHVASVPEFDASTIAAIAGGNAKRLLGM